MRDITVIDIVTEYLKQHGYDGLYEPDECACKLDNLMACENLGASCMPGWLMPGSCEDDEQCECAFHIGPVKPATWKASKEQDQADAAAAIVAAAVELVDNPPDLDAAEYTLVDSKRYEVLIATVERWQKAQEGQE